MGRVKRAVVVSYLVLAMKRSGTEDSEQGSSWKNEVGSHYRRPYPSQSRMACCLQQKCLSLSEYDFATINVPKKNANESPAQDDLRREGIEEPLFINDESLGEKDDLSCFDMS